MRLHFTEMRRGRSQQKKDERTRRKQACWNAAKEMLDGRPLKEIRVLRQRVRVLEEQRECITKEVESLKATLAERERMVQACGEDNATLLNERMRCLDLAAKKTERDEYCGESADKFDIIRKVMEGYSYTKGCLMGGGLRHLMPLAGVIGAIPALAWVIGLGLKAGRILTTIPPTPEASTIDSFWPFRPLIIPVVTVALAAWYETKARKKAMAGFRERLEAEEAAANDANGGGAP